MPESKLEAQLAALAATAAEEWNAIEERVRAEVASHRELVKTEERRHKTALGELEQQRARVSEILKATGQKEPARQTTTRVNGQRASRTPRAQTTHAVVKAIMDLPDGEKFDLITITNNTPLVKHHVARVLNHLRDMEVIGKAGSGADGDVWRVMDRDGGMELLASTAGQAEPHVAYRLTPGQVTLFQGIVEQFADSATGFTVQDVAERAGHTSKTESAKALRVFEQVGYVKAEKMANGRTKLYSLNDPEAIEELINA